MEYGGVVDAEICRQSRRRNIWIADAASHPLSLMSSGLNWNMGIVG